MSRRFPDMQRPIEPPRFIAKTIMLIIAVGAFAALACFWH